MKQVLQYLQTFFLFILAVVSLWTYILGYAVGLYPSVETVRK